ncbi:right-handed parallel beta-helix repeat-containing protein [Micromonospora costi]|uniref:Right-handed parallel beta-helix repeat-containing protein n=1 Tax=Micromonospora costi TaxID=1530042 RepID=A0A3B0A5F0_9ACTN|nr:right-handed parallel beta-helix repeat-containing protein [Micromonospora costi]RKN54547.1 right-handed parallel beta-helix repeat-containing protein [Micromonospora costi]
MRLRRLAGFAVVALVGGTGLTTTAAQAAPAARAAQAALATQAAAAPPTDLFVDQQACATGADGTQKAPFCTISAAAAVVQPGQTVWVQPGHYPETVRVTRSGTSTAPVTFRAGSVRSGVRVGRVLAGQTVTEPIFTLAGVHDVVVRGFGLEAAPTAPAVLVDGSSRITIDANSMTSATAPAGVRVTGGSSDVTISRQWFVIGGGPAVRVEAGTVRAVVTGNQTVARAGVAIADAPGAVVTGNTLVTTCGLGVSVTGASAGVSIRNNVVGTGGTGRTACADPATATALSVSGASVAGTSVDHNLIDPASGAPPYAWNGVTYARVADFVSATGQGGHDLSADPRLGAVQSGFYRSWLPLRADSPAVDSGDASAPGATATDLLGNPITDDPDVANTGPGATYRDRGAVELQGPAEAGQVAVRRVAGGGPADIVAEASPSHTWPAGGPAGSVAFQFSGTRYPLIADSTRATHTARRAGSACVTYWFSRDGFRNAGTYAGQSCTVTGAHFTAVAPTRLLDTRAAIGIPTTSPVAGKGRVQLSIPRIGGVPAADISAVVLNVTVTQPNAAGFLKVYPGTVSGTEASSVNFVAKETVPNLVTVPIGDGVVVLENMSSGTVHLVADLQGYYSAQGSGFKPLSPVRVLDTRSGTGKPIAANADLRLDLSGRLPSDATAAILNVTVTGPTAAGVLKVYPDGTPTPVASNLNFVAGQTIPNLVVVPVVAGRALIRNASSGTTHVVADLAGWFGSAASGATQSYVPFGPNRIADSRTGTGFVGRGAGPVEPRGEATVEAWYLKEFDGFRCDACPTPAAVVANLTVTAPSAAGVLTAYPYGEPRPTASNVNFVAGETASNLAVVKVGGRKLSLYNASSGGTQVIVDQSGYFVPAAS